MLITVFSGGESSCRLFNVVSFVWVPIFERKVLRSEGEELKEELEEFILLVQPKPKVQKDINVSVDVFLILLQEKNKSKTWKPFDMWISWQKGRL